MTALSNHSSIGTETIRQDFVADYEVLVGIGTGSPSTILISSPNHSMSSNNVTSRYLLNGPKLTSIGGGRLVVLSRFMNILNSSIESILRRKQTPIHNFFFFIYNSLISELRLL
jgi:hypothetical protein